MDEKKSIEIFRNYLKIDTSHPKPDYKSAVEFLIATVKPYSKITSKVVYIDEKPLLILSYKGQDQTLKGVLFNSHMDVVPGWKDTKYKSFGATMDKDGNIFARGSQDMKSVGIQALASLINLSKKNYKPQRNIFVSFVPDEEISGIPMKKFLETKEFKEMNIGAEIDEGIVSSDNRYTIYNGERMPVWITLTSTGKQGHGSSKFEHTAAENLIITLNNIIEWRDEINPKGSSDLPYINITMFEGGDRYSHNVVPGKVEANIDVRLPPKFEVSYIKDVLDKLMDKKYVTYKIVNQTSPINPKTLLHKNPWWDKIKEVFETYEYQTSIFPASTDARFFRYKGISAFGITPIINTPVLLHSDDEFVNSKEFISGIEIYTQLMKSLSSM